MAGLNFDARTVAPQQAFEPVPAGWYNVMIVASENKPTSNGLGAYLELALKVIDGAHAGRQFFDRLNLQNQNPVAQEIAYRRLSAYCHATGVIQVADSQQLHGIPFKVKVSVRVDSTGQYDPSNEVKGVKHINEDVGGMQPAAAAMANGAHGSFGNAPAAAPQQQQPSFAQPGATFQQPPQQPAEPQDGSVPPWARR